jgi:hypothetical protein
MTETTNAKPSKSKDRSPSYPFINLKTAIERLEAFEKFFGRHAAPFKKAGLAWKMKEESSQANQTLATLKSFGLVNYQGTGKDRLVAISDEGRTYLRAQQDSVKKEVLKRAALKPRAIARFWPTWGVDRPPDAVCLDDLVLKHKFNEKAAPTFLKVYDDSIAFAGLSPSDKIDPSVLEEDEENDGDEDGEGRTQDDSLRRPPPPVSRKGEVKLMEGERVVFTEEGQPHQYLKLIASGDLDDVLLEALEDYLKRQRKRLSQAAALQSEIDKSEAFK